MDEMCYESSVLKLSKIVVMRKKIQSMKRRKYFVSHVSVFSSSQRPGRNPAGLVTITTVIKYESGWRKSAGLWECSSANKSIPLRMVRSRV